MGSGVVGSGGSGSGSSGGSGDAAASNVQERDAKCLTPDQWGGADLSDNEKDSDGAGSYAAKRPRPAQWAEMNKRPETRQLGYHEPEPKEALEI